MKKSFSTIFQTLAPSAPKRRTRIEKDFSDPIPAELENLSRKTQSFSGDSLLSLAAYALRCRNSKDFLSFVSRKFPEVHFRNPYFRYLIMTDTVSYAKTLAVFCDFFRLRFHLSDRQIFNLCREEFEIFRMIDLGYSLDSIVSILGISKRFLYSYIDSINEKLIKGTVLGFSCGFTPEKLREKAISMCYAHQKTFSVKFATLLTRFYHKRDYLFVLDRPKKRRKSCSK